MDGVNCGHGWHFGGPCEPCDHEWEQVWLEWRDGEMHLTGGFRCRKCRITKPDEGTVNVLQAPENESEGGTADASSVGLMADGGLHGMRSEADGWPSMGTVETSADYWFKEVEAGRLIIAKLEAEIAGYKQRLALIHWWSESATKADAVGRAGEYTATEMNCRGCMGPCGRCDELRSGEDDGSAPTSSPRGLPRPIGVDGRSA